MVYYVSNCHISPVWRIILGVNMKKNIRDLLEDWPKSYIKDVDLSFLINRTDDARYSIVKRALKRGLLSRIKKGLYVIPGKTKTLLIDEFELALFVYAPSVISLESALSYHGWIPEAVYATTCVTPKRAQEFKTPVGIFSYKHVPEDDFYLGVSRVVTKSGAIVFIADPWRALADLMYNRRKSWKDLEHLESDLRIDVDTLKNSDKKLLRLLIKKYPSTRVRDGLKRLLGFLK